MEQRKVWFERKDGEWGTKLYPVSDEERANALDVFANTGKCDEHLVYDEPGWPYDLRYCWVCGAYLGLV